MIINLHPEAKYNVLICSLRVNQTMGPQTMDQDTRTKLRNITQIETRRKLVSYAVVVIAIILPITVFQQAFISSGPIGHRSWRTRRICHNQFAFLHVHSRKFFCQRYSSKVYVRVRDWVFAYLVVSRL